MIKAPNWKKDAIPTPRGWVHPVTDELLVSTRISEDQIKEFTKPKKKKRQTNKVKVEEEKVESLNEVESTVAEEEIKNNNGFLSRMLKG